MRLTETRQLCLLLLLACSHTACGVSFALKRCEPIAVSECDSVPYNNTMRLNGQEVVDQRDAAVRVQSFEPLIQYHCHKELRLFLCLTMAPMCVEHVDKPLGPCLSFCESVFDECRPVMRRFGFEWPDYMACHRMTDDRKDDSALCVSPLSIKNKGRRATTTMMPVATTSEVAAVEGEGSGGSVPQRVTDWRQFLRKGQFPNDCSHLRNKEQFVYINSTGQCALQCSGSDLFTDEDRKLAEVWMGALAILCAVSSLATLLTFLIDRSRFKYPLRPVIFMAMCYLCYSISYFVRLIAGREASACDRDPSSGKQILIQRGLDNTNCAIVFLLQYFFSTAASTWYVILVLTWLLQAGWKWSPEAVARRSCYFHLPAWIIPVALTVCVLIARKVEADDLFGMCNVGNQNRSTLLTFVIIPNVAFLALEFVFLVAGLVAMSKVRRHVKSDGQQTNKFDILMGKIGLFSALYILPTASITGMNIFEYIQRELWHMPGTPYAPNVPLMLIKVFASLVIGLTTILWILGAKTAMSWRRLFVPDSRRPAGGVPYPKTAYQVGLSQQQQQQHAMQQSQHQDQHLQVAQSPAWPKQQQHHLQQHQPSSSLSSGAGRFSSSSEKSRLAALPPQPHNSVVVPGDRSTFL